MPCSILSTGLVLVLWMIPISWHIPFLILRKDWKVNMSAYGNMKMLFVHKFYFIFLFNFIFSLWNQTNKASIRYKTVNDQKYCHVCTRWIMSQKLLSRENKFFFLVFMGEYFCEKYYIFDVSQTVFIYSMYCYVVFTDYIYPRYVVFVQYVTILCFSPLSVIT